MATSDTWDPTQWPAGTSPSGNNPSKGQEAIALLSGALPSLIYRMTSGGNSNIPPQLLQLLQQQTDRMSFQNPLFEATTRQAFEGLPAYARDGLSFGSFQNSPVGMPSGGSGLGAGIGAGAGVGLGLAKRLAPWAVKALQHLFGGTQPGVMTGPQQPGGSGGGLPFGGAGSPGGAPIGSNDYNFLMNNGLAGTFGIGPTGGIGDQMFGGYNSRPKVQAY